jgi:hypothetical protein
MRGDHGDVVNVHVFESDRKAQLRKGDDEFLSSEHIRTQNNPKKKRKT